MKNTENDVKIHHLEAAKAENKAKIGHLEAKNAGQDKEINELRTSQNTKLEKPSSLHFLVNHRPKPPSRLPTMNWQPMVIHSMGYTWSKILEKRIPKQFPEVLEPLVSLRLIYDIDIVNIYIFFILLQFSKSLLVKWTLKPNLFTSMCRGKAALAILMASFLFKWLL